MSNPGTPHLQRPEALKNLAQLRIERLKKEEEEEQWISGEELYTEGSSDEDDMAVRTKRKANEKGGKKSTKPVGNKLKKQIKDEVVKSPNSLSLPQIPLPCTPSKERAVQKQQPVSGTNQEDVTGNKIEKESMGASGDVSSSTSVLAEDEETDAEISWRPKRGDENSRILPIQSAENAYKTVVEKVKKLKDLLSNETNIVSWINESNANGFFGDINFNTSNSCDTKNNNNNMHSCKNLIKESYDVNSALTNIEILDHLIDITASKEKEAREKTIDVEVKITEELRHLCNSNDLECDGDGDGADDELLENTSNFLQLFSLKEESDISKVKKIFTDLKHMNLSEDTESKHNDPQCDNMQKAKFLDVSQSTKKSAIETEDVNLISHLGEVLHEFSGEDCEEIPTLTDEEKQRVVFLLEDSGSDVVNIVSESNDGENVGKSYLPENLSGSVTKPYQVNNKTKEDLEEINEKLKVFANTSREKTCTEKLRYISCPSKELFDCNELSEGDYEQQCLKNIDELLDVLNKPIKDEIQPLTPEEIQDLIKKYPGNYKEEEQQKKYDTQSNNSKNVNRTETVKKVNSEILKKLIEEAKTAMPQFKFKYSA